VWGGPNSTDNCGDCDDDPTNDCVQDCAGVWGGEAFLDECDDCVGGTTGREPCELHTADTGLPPKTTPTTTGGTTPSTTPTVPGEPTTTDDGTDDTGDVPMQPVSYQRVGGCGCSQGAAGGAWLLVGLPLLGLRRRR
jgi:hypothetical protein